MNAHRELTARIARERDFGVLEDRVLNLEAHFGLTALGTAHENPGNECFERFVRGRTFQSGRTRGLRGRFRCARAHPAKERSEKVLRLLRGRIRLQSVVRGPRTGVSGRFRPLARAGFFKEGRLLVGGSRTRLRRVPRDALLLGVSPESALKSRDVGA